MLLKEENRLTERARAYASSAEHMLGKASRMMPPASAGGAEGSNRTLRPEAPVRVRLSPYKTHCLFAMGLFFMLLKEENRLTERARAYASSADSRNGRSE